MSIDQEMLLSAVERLFANYQESEASGWTEALSDLGLEYLFTPEEQGGLGGGWADALIVLKQAGRFHIGAPVAETLIASCVMNAGGLSPENAPFSIAPHFDGELTGNSDGSVFASGKLSAVPWGGDVQHVVFASRLDDQPCLAISPIQAVSVGAESTNVAGEPRVDLILESAAIPEIGQLRSYCNLYRYGALARTCQAAGALNSILELTVNHANDRVQFGRPIAKFQAIQQNLAILAGEVAAANSAASAACAAVQQSQGWFEVAAAKLRVNQAIGQVTGIAHQTLGAIGITREHDLHQYTRRLWAWRSEFGNDRYWARELGTHVIRRGAHNFWPDLTSAHSQPVQDSN